jgi:hypothetical protein
MTWLQKMLAPRPDLSALEHESLTRAYAKLLHIVVAYEKEIARLRQENKQVTECWELAARLAAKYAIENQRLRYALEIATPKTPDTRN